MRNTDLYDFPGSDEWVYIGEAAAILGLSVKTLRRYDESGVLRAQRTPGNRRRYRRAQIEAVLRGDAA